MKSGYKKHKIKKYIRILTAICLQAVFLLTACSLGDSDIGQPGEGVEENSQNGSSGSDRGQTDGAVSENSRNGSNSSDNGQSDGGTSGSGQSESVPQTKGQIRLGMTLSDQYDAYIIKLVNAVNASVNAKEQETGTDINLEIYNAAGSETTQNGQILSMIDNQCDVICVNPADAAVLSEVLAAADKAQIPLIFFDIPEWLAWNFSDSVSGDFYYVGNDPIRTGIQAGDLALEVLQKAEQPDKDRDGCIACVTLITEDTEMDGWGASSYQGTVSSAGGSQFLLQGGTAGENRNTSSTEGTAVLNGSDDSLNRETDAIDLYISPMDAALAACSTWDAYPVMNLGSLNAGGGRKQAQLMMEQQLSGSGNQIELILAQTDEMALGAADALKAAGITADNWPVIVGIGGTEVGLEGIRKGQISGTIYRDKEGEAEKLIDLAYRLSAGDDTVTDRAVILPGIPVTAEHAGEYSGY